MITVRFWTAPKPAGASDSPASDVTMIRARTSAVCLEVLLPGTSAVYLGTAMYYVKTLALVKPNPSALVLAEAGGRTCACNKYARNVIPGRISSLRSTSFGFAV